jgi:hypothetical protein
MNRSWNCTAACSAPQVQWPGDLQAPMAHTDTSSCGPPPNLRKALAHFSIPTDKPQLRGQAHIRWSSHAWRKGPLFHLRKWALSLQGGTAAQRFAHATKRFALRLSVGNSTKEH